MNNHQQANHLVKQGIAAYKAGDKATARTLLKQAIQHDHQHQAGWLWLSFLTDAPARKQECLERVLALNPTSEAGKRAQVELDRLNATDIELPPFDAATPAQPSPPQHATTSVFAQAGVPPSVSAKPVASEYPQKSVWTFSVWTVWTVLHALVCMAFSGSSFMIAIPIAQWFMLHRYLPKAYEWVLATLAGLVLALVSYFGFYHILGTLPDTWSAWRFTPTGAMIEIGLNGILLGTGIGIGQWSFLKRHLRASGWWILASILGWTVMQVTSMQTLRFQMSNALWIQALAGMFYGVITGMLLVRLRPVAGEG